MKLILHQKTYWSIIKTLVNGKNVPVIPQILVNNKLVNKFQDKADIINEHFSKQYQPIPNNSTLPSIKTFESSKRLSSVDIDFKKILKLIQCLNSNKAHGHNGISVRTLELSGPLIIKPLSLLFSSSLRDRFFPKIGKNKYYSSA